MIYHRKPVDIPEYDLNITEHYRDGVLVSVTEQKRKHAFTDADTLTDIVGRRRKFEAFASLVKKGRHDLACYIYHLT